MLGIRALRCMLDTHLADLWCEVRAGREEVRQFRSDLDRKWRLLVLTQQQYNDMIAALTAKVSAQTDVDTSAAALIQGLQAQIKDLIARSDGIVDTGQLQKLADALDAGTRSLSAAVAANQAPTAPAPAPAEASDPSPAPAAAPAAQS